MYDYVKAVETIRLEAKQLQESISYLKSQNDGKVWSGDQEALYGGEQGSASQSDRMSEIRDHSVLDEEDDPRTILNYFDERKL